MNKKHAIESGPNPHGSFQYDPQRVSDLGYQEGFKYALTWTMGRPVPAAVTSSAESGHKYNAEYVAGYKSGLADGIASRDADVQAQWAKAGSHAVPVRATARRRKTANIDSETHPNGVVELFADDEAELDGMPGVAICGHCGRAWVDSIITSVTPTPGGRCPFEYEHDDDGYYTAKRTAGRMATMNRCPHCRITVDAAREGEGLVNGYMNTYYRCPKCAKQFRVKYEDDSQFATASITTRRKSKMANRRTADIMDSKCPVCGSDADLWCAIDGKPCMNCIKARQRAAQDGRCHCGRKAIPGEERSTGGINGRSGRRWIPCERCLGTIRQTARRKTAGSDIHTYKIRLQHDEGYVNITTTATSPEQAVSQILRAEGAPQSAVVSCDDLGPVLARRRQASEYNRELSELDQTPSDQDWWGEHGGTPGHGAADVASVPTPGAANSYPQPGHIDQDSAVGEEAAQAWDGAVSIDKDAARQFRARVQAGLRRMGNRRRVARRKVGSISLTNVRIVDRAGLICKGVDPSGKVVQFKVTQSDMKDLTDVMYSDMAGNFSGVSIEESDIISPTASRKTAGLCDTAYTIDGVSFFCEDCAQRDFFSQGYEGMGEISVADLAERYYPDDVKCSRCKELMCEHFDDDEYYEASRRRRATRKVATPQVCSRCGKEEPWPFDSASDRWICASCAKKQQNQNEYSGSRRRATRKVAGLLCDDCGWEGDNPDLVGGPEMRSCPRCGSAAVYQEDYLQMAARKRRQAMRRRASRR